MVDVGRRAVDGLEEGCHKIKAVFGDAEKFLVSRNLFVAC